MNKLLAVDNNTETSITEAFEAGKALLQDVFLVPYCAHGVKNFFSSEVAYCKN
jgi:hypothetical protein